MKPSRIVESGVVREDGRLYVPMDRVNDYATQHKGERVIVTIEAVPKEATIAQKTYYYKYVLPTIVEALYKKGERISEQDADVMLIGAYPGDLKIGEVYASKASELTSTQMSDFLDWLKQYAAEHLEVYVEDPRTI